MLLCGHEWEAQMRVDVWNLVIFPICFALQGVEGAATLPVKESSLPTTCLDWYATRYTDMHANDSCCRSCGKVWDGVHTADGSWFWCRWVWISEKKILELAKLLSFPTCKFNCLEKFLRLNFELHTKFRLLVLFFEIWKTFSCFSSMGPKSQSTRPAIDHYSMTWPSIERSHWALHDGAKFQPWMRVDIWNFTLQAGQNRPCHPNRNSMQAIFQWCMFR